MTRARLPLRIGLAAALVLAAALFGAPRAARAQPSAASYAVSWSVVAGGGGTSTGGVYHVSGTAGQADAGRQTGGGYSLGGGFWSGLVQALHTLFLPLTRR